jgi:hypothetical protein
MSSLDQAKRDKVRAAIDEAVGRLSHRCRMYPSLKLRPAVCAKRKAMKQKIAHGRYSPIYEACKDCQGPVPLILEDGPESDSGTEVPARSSVSRRKKKLDPTTCNICGKPTEETQFYPSNPHTCIQCLNERERRCKLSARKTWKEEPEPMEPATAVESPPPDPETEALKDSTTESVVQELPYTCEIHGPHAGRMFGRSHSKLCPACYREKASILMKEVRARGTTHPQSNGRKEIILPDWVSAWAEEQAAGKGIPGREFVIGIIGERIPAEWIKQHLLTAKE